MRRLLFAALLLCVAGLYLPAQEHGHPAPSTAERAQPAPTGDHAVAEAGQHGGSEHGESDNLAIWKWANFAILAGVLGWMVGKAAPQFFRSRTAEIQRGIAEATRMKQDAEARAAKMEQRMASLESEIARLRSDAKTEMAKEADRLRRESEQHIARIQAHGEQEISAMGKHAEQQLHAYSAELALKLAEQRIRERMTPDSEQILFDGFVQQLNSKGGRTEVRQ